MGGVWPGGRRALRRAGGRICWGFNGRWRVPPRQFEPKSQLLALAGDESATERDAAIVISIVFP
jgi:hypothetical protein